MTAYKSNLTQARLKELLHYNPESGELTWLTSRSIVKKGQIAGHKQSPKTNKSYIIVGIDGYQISAHRLIWLYMTGSFPPDQIDHIDGNGLNNKWENLRIVTNAENKKNKKMPRNNTSGVMGVCKSSKYWYAYIGINRKNINLYIGDDFFEAICARKSAEIKYDYHPNHGCDRPLY